jgi:peptidyl-tRNA hydrolase, PTH1 family
MLVVGLGNPGQKYVCTRHNVGRDILLEIIKNDNFSELKVDRYSNALVSEGHAESLGETTGEKFLDDKRVIIALPGTFMNQSGEAVKELVKKYALTPESVVIVHDDIDLPFGRIKISKDRGDGGHNGVKSVVEHLGTRDFSRIRIGICPVNEGGEKSKPHKDVVSGYVLGHFSREESDNLHTLAKRVNDALAAIARVGVTQAMNLINESS